MHSTRKPFLKRPDFFIDSFRGLGEVPKPYVLESSGSSLSSPSLYSLRSVALVHLICSIFREVSSSATFASGNML